MQYKNRHRPHMTCEELRISDERKELFVILNKKKNYFQARKTVGKTSEINF